MPGSLCAEQHGNNHVAILLQVPVCVMAYLTTFHFCAVAVFFWLDFMPIIGLVS